MLERAEERLPKPLSFSKVWTKPVGKGKGKVCTKTAHDEVGNQRPSHIQMSDMLWCLAKEDTSLSELL